MGFGGGMPSPEQMAQLAQKMPGGGPAGVSGLPNLPPTMPGLPPKFPGAPGGLPGLGGKPPLPGLGGFPGLGKKK
jgi:signal recognition particle subunit SRP54